MIFLSGCSNDSQSNVDKISFYSKYLDKEMIVLVYRPPEFSEDVSYSVLYFIVGLYNRQKYDEVKK